MCNAKYCIAALLPECVSLGRIHFESWGLYSGVALTLFNGDACGSAACVSEPLCSEKVDRLSALTGMLHVV